MKNLYFYLTLCFFSHYITSKPIETFNEFITKIQNIDGNLININEIESYIHTTCHTWDIEKRELIKSILSNQKVWINEKFLPYHGRNAAISLCIMALASYLWIKKHNFDLNYFIIAIGSGIISFTILEIPEQLILDSIENLKKSF